MYDDNNIFAKILRSEIPCDKVYEDEDAHMKAHRNAPHYKKWRDTVSDWFDGDTSSVAMDTVFPSDEGWKAQKPCLLNW